MAMKAKRFDAIEMSRQIRAAISSKLSTMTRKHQLAYLREAAERHRKEIQAREHSMASKR